MEEELLKHYPNVTINNRLFLEEKCFNDFNYEELSKLVSLPSSASWLLYSHLYSFGNPKVIKDILLQIAKRTPNYFNSENKEIFEYSNLIQHYQTLYNLRPITKDEVIQAITENAKNAIPLDGSIYDIDISYIDALLGIQKLFPTKQISFKEIEPFINFNEELLRNRIITEKKNYESLDIKISMSIISYIITRKIPFLEIYNSFNSNYTEKSLITYGKFGTQIKEYNRISLEIINTISEKHMKLLIKEINEKQYDKKEFRYTYDELVSILLKMNAYLPYPSLYTIIKKLPNDPKKAKRLFEAFKDINVINVHNTNYKEGFVHFFIGDNFDEPNSLLNHIYRNDTILKHSLEEIYNSWESIIIRSQNQPLDTLYAFIEHYLKSNPVVLNPDEYKLEGKIINICFDNRQYQRQNKIDMTSEIRRVYKQMKHLYKKSIPYIKGNYKKYRFETLKANDPNLFIQGSETDNCFKIGGDADSFVKYCALNENGRVLSITNKQGEIVAMVPMVRNGNVLLCNSIEGVSIKNQEFVTDMFTILEFTANTMIEISQNHEKEKGIKAVLIGNYKNEINHLEEIPTFKKYPAINYGEITNKVLRPLDNTIYANMGGFDWKNYLIASTPNLNFYELHSFTPDILYCDPRKKTIEIEYLYNAYEDFEENNDWKNAYAQVNDIHYEKYKRNLEDTDIEKIIYNEDWYILITQNGEIKSECITLNPQAKIEYEDYLKNIYEFYNTNTENKAL